MKKKKRRIWVWIVLVVVAAALVGGWLYLRHLGEQLTKVTYQTHTVDYGTVARAITGSGRLAPFDTENVEAEANIKIESVKVRAGDAVSAGDLLLTYDTEAISDRIETLYTELSSLDQQIMRRTSRESINAPTTGRVKAIYAQPGDDLETVMREKGALALLSADEKMQVDIVTDVELALGKNVTVIYEGGRQTGTVANLIDGGYRITLTDNNVPMDVTAEVFDRDTKLGEGTLAVHGPIYVYGRDGVVQSVNVNVNAYVYAGTKLFTLADKPDSAAYADAVRSREDKVQDIQALYALLNDPVLTAPVSGTVAEVRAQEGSPVTGAAFVLHTGGATKMTVNVDELDIGVMSLGQEATVTLDAFAGESFAASVTHISRLGTPSGSITTYAVELTLAPDDRLLEGMNGSAVITAQQKDHVLLLPVAAIHEDETGVYVYVQSGEEAIRRDITTGLSDGTNAEITSGLNAGDVVRYQDEYIGIAEQYQQYMRNDRGGR